MRLHTIKYYNDGNKRVEYCCVCGAEGLELNKDCPGEFKETVKLPDWWANKLDIDTEPY